MNVEAKHTSEDDVIAFGTDPWLQVVGDPEPVDLTQFDSHAFPAGVFAPVNDVFGIERDDAAAVFEGDFEAAEAMAAHLHDITGLDYEVWFERSPE